MINEAKLSEAAKTLCGGEPPAWLLGYFRMAIYSIDNWYASGGGRFKKSVIRKKLDDFLIKAEALQSDLNDWGSVFASGNENFSIIERARRDTPELIEAIKEARKKFPDRLNKGQNVASVGENDLTLKKILALAVWIAAQEMGLTSEPVKLEKTCAALAKASRLSDPELDKITDFGGVGREGLNPPSLAGSWTAALQAAKSVKPRIEGGSLMATEYGYPLFKTSRDFASEFSLKLRAWMIGGVKLIS